MLAQTRLPFQFEIKADARATAFAGLPLYVELGRASGLVSAVAEELAVQKPG